VAIEPPGVVVAQRPARRRAARGADLLSREALDLGYRLPIADIGARRAT
jgi:hypothetical protein